MPVFSVIFTSLIRHAVKSGIAIAVVIFVLCQTGSAAQLDFGLSLPVGCNVGGVCTIQNYVDRDPGPEARDYTCGRLVYDGHKGTDFRLPDARWLDCNIQVLAAAPGQVIGTRNNARDHAPGRYEPERIKGRECGNGVVIDHGGGWRTQYCHMRQGSIRVRKGDQVKRQQILGTIGLSGKTEFPHLHFAVRFRGKVVDPFLGAEAKAGCGVNGQPLWLPDVLLGLRYRPSGVLASGFTDELPTLTQVVAGRHRRERLGRAAANLVYWVMIFGLQPGDEEVLRLLAPDGSVLHEKRSKPAKRHKARWFTYSGKRRRQPWVPGTYIGEYQLLRKMDGRNQVVLKSTTKVEID